MIKLHSNVILTKDLPDLQLRQGDVGVVVHIHPSAKAFEVEFMTYSGQTIAVCTLELDDIQPLKPDTIPQARELVT